MTIPDALAFDWVLVISVMTTVVTILMLLWVSRQHGNLRGLIEHLSAKTELVLEQNKRQAEMLMDERRAATFKDGIAQGVELERIREETEKATLITGLAHAARQLIEEEAQVAKQLIEETVSPTEATTKPKSER